MEATLCLKTRIMVIIRDITSRFILGGVDVRFVNCKAWWWWQHAVGLFLVQMESRYSKEQEGTPPSSSPQCLEG